MEKKECPSRRAKLRRPTSAIDIETFDIDRSLKPGDALFIDCVSQTLTFVVNTKLDKVGSPSPNVGTLSVYDVVDRIWSIYDNVVLNSAYARGSDTANILVENGSVLFVLNNGEVINASEIRYFRKYSGSIV